MSVIFICSLIYNYFFKYRYFRVLETSISQLMEGARHAHNFASCRIKLRTKNKADQLIFDELWIEDRLYKVRITNEENQQVQSKFREKEILYIEVESEVNDTLKAPPTENPWSQIFLGYQVGNKRKYLKIGTISNDLPQLSVA